MSEKTGVIYGINGPVIYMKDAPDFKMSEMVYVGEERLVAVHKDLDDEAQTITRPEKPKKPRKPGKSSGSPGTGDSHDYKGLAAWIALCAAGIVAAALYRKRGTNS